MATKTLKDLSLSLEDRPGTMADAGEALGNAGVNIEGICGFPVSGRGLAHFLVEDAARARKALEGAGVKVTAEHDVLVVDVADRPGTLGQVTRKLAKAGVNLNLIYLATNTRLVIGADNLDKARGAI
jgi:hypothetical protein